jgi:hypothetical protein
MKTRNLSAMVFVLALGLFSALAMAEQIDNPNYKTWASYKPGSWAKYTIVSDGGNFKTEMVMTMKLMEVTPEKVTLEYSNTMNVGGQKIDTPPQKSDIPAKTEKAAGDDKTKVDVTTKDAGQEDVAVGGKSYKCKVQETTTKSPQGTATGKSWTSEEVPGGTVKAVTKMEGAAASTTTMTLAECNVAK